VEILAVASDIHTFTRPTGVKDYITSITLSSLETDTSYSYFARGASEDNSTESDTFTFHTLPEDTSTLQIGVYGDLGAYGTAIVEKGNGGLLYWTENHKFDFIIHNGDLAYNLGSNSGETGNDFLTSIEAASARTPYIVTPGNHEFMDSSEQYYNNWFLGQTKLGTNSGSDNPIMYYSFDVGSKLHIVVISTEVYCEDHDSLMPQYEWLSKDLAAVRARSVQPWILAFGHRQIYMGTTSTFHARLMRLGLQCNDSTLQHCDFTPCDSNKDCGYSIEKLFAQYKVDMYFAGHQHTYNRMFPISDTKTYEAQDMTTYINPQHPVYVISGAAGIQNSHSKELKDKAADSPTVVSVDGYSFSLVSVINATHLQLEQIDVTNGTVVDSFWIAKDSSLPPWNKLSTLSIENDSSAVCDQ
jgi:3',5'-cyclic AMP phosphodiesterase CpdA